MQPYFFPYIGYFQLINSVDKFVIYDNIEYTKKGWINRNRILVGNKDQLITLPIKKDSDYLTVVDRTLADSWPKDREKIINVLKQNYSKAPYFIEVYSLIRRCLDYKETNLFKFIQNTLVEIKNYLNIKADFIISSSIEIDHSLRSEEKVITICKALGATDYINAIGGIELYSKDRFLNNDINLKFIKSHQIKYKQFNDEFLPWLSIIDVLMFNSIEQVKLYLKEYTLI